MQLTVVFRELKFRLENVVRSFKSMQLDQRSGTGASCVQWMMKHNQGVRCFPMIARRRVRGGITRWHSHVRFLYECGIASI